MSSSRTKTKHCHHPKPLQGNNTANLSSLSTSLASFSSKIEKDAKEILRLSNDDDDNDKDSAAAILDASKFHHHMNEATKFLEAQHARVSKAENDLLEIAEVVMNIQHQQQTEDDAEPSQQTQQQPPVAPLPLTDLAELSRSLHVANARRLLHIEKELERYGYQPTEARKKEKNCLTDGGGPLQSSDLDENASSGIDDKDANYSTPKLSSQEQQQEDDLGIINGIHAIGLGEPLDQVVEVDNETDATMTTPGSCLESPPFMGQNKSYDGNGLPSTSSPVNLITPTLENLQLSDYMSLYGVDTGDKNDTKDDLPSDSANNKNKPSIESLTTVLEDGTNNDKLGGEKRNKSENNHTIEEKELLIDADEQSVGESCDDLETAHSSQVESSKSDLGVDESVREQQITLSNDDVSGKKHGSEGTGHDDNGYNSDDESEDETYDSQLDESAMYSDEFTEDTHDMYSIASTVLAEHRRVQPEVSKNDADTTVNSEAQDVTANVLDDTQQGNESESDDTTVTEVSEESSSQTGGGNKCDEKSTPSTECYQSPSLAEQQDKNHKVQTPMLPKKSRLSSTFIAEYGEDIDDDESMLVTPIPDRSLPNKKDPGTGVTSSTQSLQRLRCRLDSPKEIIGDHDIKEADLHEQTGLDDSMLTIDTFESQNKFLGTPRPKAAPFSPAQLHTPSSQFDTDGSPANNNSTTQKVYPKTPVIKIPLVSENDDDVDEVQSATTAQSARVIDDQSYSNKSEGDDESSQIAAVVPLTPHASVVVGSTVECNRESDASSATEKTAHMTPKPKGGTLHGFPPKGSPLCRTPLTAAFLAKHMPEEKERLLSGLSRSESRFSSLLRESRPSENGISGDTSKETTRSQPTLLMKPITAEEYDGSLQIVKILVKLDEVNSAIETLNNWFSQRYKTRKNGIRVEISETEAYKVLGETFTEKKIKSLLTSIRQWRRLTMRTSPNGDRSYFVVSS